MLKWFAFTSKSEMSLSLIRIGGIIGTFLPLQKVFKIDQ